MAQRTVHTRVRPLLTATRLLLVGLLGLFATLASGRTTNDFTLELRERIGPYRYWRTLETGGAYRLAVASFGGPTRVDRDSPQSNLCIARWSSLGLSIGFAGARGGCTARNLRTAAWYGMRLWDPRWMTARGLRVGDRVEDLTRLYPRARPAPRARNEWWLVVEHQKEFGTKPLLVAEFRRGRVVAIRVPAGYVF
jgi:hypothetical protein